MTSGLPDQESHLRWGRVGTVMKSRRGAVIGLWLMSMIAAAWWLIGHYRTGLGAVMLVLLVLSAGIGIAALVATHPRNHARPEGKHSAPSPEYAPPAREVALGLSYGMIGLAVITAAVLVAVVPLVLAWKGLGDNGGISLGCLVSIVLQLGLLRVLARYPRIPGAQIVVPLSARIMFLEALLAPLGVAEVLVPPPWLGALVGFGAGFGLIAVAFQLPRLPRVQRWLRQFASLPVGKPSASRGFFRTVSPYHHHDGG
jgi:hypothetical protein